MTFGNAARVEGFLSNLSVNGFDVSYGGGRTFQALVSSEQMIDPDAELGADPREYIVIDSIREDTPNLLAQQTISVEGVNLRITRRDNNPSDPLVRHWAVKII